MLSTLITRSEGWANFNCWPPSWATLRNRISAPSALESMKALPLIAGTYHFTAQDHNGLRPSDVHLAVDKNAIWFNLD